MSNLLEQFIQITDGAITALPLLTVEDVNKHYAKELATASQSEPFYKLFHGLIYKALSSKIAKGNNRWLIDLKRNLWLRGDLSLNIGP